ncbi:calcium-binding protein [Aliigemmobacter aestuarii]|nr:hypothetical protein [Gemmobacter aestuarii]
MILFDEIRDVRPEITATRSGQIVTLSVAYQTNGYYDDDLGYFLFDYGNASLEFGDDSASAFVGGDDDGVILISVSDDSFNFTGPARVTFMTDSMADEFVAEFMVSSYQSAATLNGSALADVFFGSAESDAAFGKSGNDTLLGFSGKDTLLGGLGRDLLQGGRGNDTLNGGRNADRMLGEVGNDRLIGGRAGDVLLGLVGADTLLGGAGADTLDGGRGNDLLRGGTGADTFVMGLAFGRDRIDDFNPTGAQSDRIDLSALSEITGFADLSANHMRQVGGRVEITDGTNRLILFGTDIDTLTASDFLF